MEGTVIKTIFFQRKKKKTRVSKNNPVIQTSGEGPKDYHTPVEENASPRSLEKYAHGRHSLKHGNTKKLPVLWLEVLFQTQSLAAPGGSRLATAPTHVQWCKQYLEYVESHAQIFKELKGRDDQDKIQARGG